MFQLVVLVLDNPDQCRDILDAWEAVGVPGVTILDSSGLGRVRRAALRDDLPLMPSLSNLLESDEDRHRTLFTLIKDPSLIDVIVEATQAVIGHLDNADTGLMFVVPVSQVYGLRKVGGKDNN